MDLGLDANAVTPSVMGRCWRLFQKAPPPTVRWAWLLTGLGIVDHDAFPWVFGDEREGDVAAADVYDDPPVAVVRQVARRGRSGEVSMPDYGPVPDKE